MSKPEMKCSLDIPVCCNKSTKAGENGENYARLTAQHDDDAAHRRRSDIASSHGPREVVSHNARSDWHMQSAHFRPVLLPFWSYTARNLLELSLGRACR